MTLAYRGAVIRHTAITNLRNENKAGTGVVSISTGITQLKQSQSELSYYAAQLQRLAQASAMINASLTLPEILEAITEQTQTIIGAHMAGPA